MDEASPDAFVFQYAAIFAVALAIYIVPTVIAFSRRHPNRYAILAVNLVFGGTGIGWLGSLIWAFNAVHLPVHPDRSPGGESGLNLFVNDIRPVRLIPEQTTGVGMSPGPRLSVAQAAAELEKLSQLYAAGNLNNSELAVLKRAVLDRVRAG